MRAGIYIDSGGWIAFLSRRDRHHREASQLFRRVVKQKTGLLTSNLVLAEVHRQILFRAGVAPALGALERMTKVARVSVEFVTRADHESALEWLGHFRDQPFTYTDATSFAIMKRRGVRLVIGFDHHFEVAGFERWRLV